MTLHRLLQVVSFVGLGLSILPAFLVFTGAIDKPFYFGMMLVGMICWFGSAIFWVGVDHQK